ncbi:MAG: hypothetical protein ACR2N0_13005 [Rubrobacteraceae bacterium]
MNISPAAAGDGAIRPDSPPFARQIISMSADGTRAGDGSAPFAARPLLRRDAPTELLSDAKPLVRARGSEDAASGVHIRRRGEDSPFRGEWRMGEREAEIG